MPYSIVSDVAVGYACKRPEEGVSCVGDEQFSAMCLGQSMSVCCSDQRIARVVHVIMIVFVPQWLNRCARGPLLFGVSFWNPNTL